MRIVIVILIFLVSNSQAQILINEVSSASTPGYVDEDGDQEDWIELYNTTASPINLQDYTIRYRESTGSKDWRFPSVVIQPNEFLTVFASEKNRKTWFDHWEVPVFANNPWKYFIGTTNPPPTWRDVTFNDASWLTGAGGIGYGDGDDSTVVPPCWSIYMRKSFFIADTSIIPTCALLLDFDDAFVAYLNGVEIARYGIGVQGDSPAYNVSAYDEHEAQLYSTGNFSAAFFISPEMVDSALKPGNNVLTIQTHNYSGGLDDLSSIVYFLIGVNSTTVTYYPFPADIRLHTNFNLHSSGQSLILKNPTGLVIDSVNIGPMQMSDSRGRSPDGSTNWCLFDISTPDTTNNPSACYLDYGAPANFNLAAGFYNTTQMVSISSVTPGSIRYTTNGNEPTLFSSIYTAPLTIGANTVLRAKVFPSNPVFLPATITTNSYFINENITLPVISLTSDHYNLFDYNYGIYEMGPNADSLNLPYQGANFWQGWERPANIEYFDENNAAQFEISSGIKIQGNFSKSWPQRGFTVKAKDNYGGTDVNYLLFPDKPNITSYRSFNIRNAGSDWNTCHFRDRLNQKSVQEMCKVEVMDGRPCVLFINGMYWGVYELREKQDENYIESNTGFSKDKLDFLEFDGSIISGSNKGFLDMVSFISTNDMSLSANYDSAKAMLDIENFADYFAIETYVVNIDWLGTYTNNIKFWRSNKPVTKWRYMLWDTDLSLGFLPSFGGSDTTNMLSNAINPPNYNPHSAMLNSLLNNTEFKNYFVNRYADLMNTIFTPSVINNKAMGIHDEMLPEMSRHFTRWSGTSPMPGYIGRSNNVPEWEIQIDSLQLFTNNRQSIARNYVQQQFGLAKQVDVTLNVEPAGAGIVQISTIVPTPLPWSGVYFDGVPVTMHIRSNPGYKFLYWKSDNIITTENTDTVITLNIDTNDVFTAYFREFENSILVYPNPFSDAFTVEYEVRENMQAELLMYDVLGKKVKTFFSYETFQAQGKHSLTVNPHSFALATGVYILKYKSGDFESTIKLVREK